MNTCRNRTRPAWLVCVAFAVSLIAGIGAPLIASADTDLGDGDTGVIAYADGDRVRLRSGPGTDSSSMGLFPEGTQVEVQGGIVAGSDGGSWYKVSVQGQTGYIQSDFIANSDRLFTRTSGSAVTTAALNLRTGPSTADRIVTTLGSGQQVTLTGENRQGWLSVSTGNRSGYVYGAFLTAGAAASETRYTLDRVHLRTGPGTGNSSIRVLPVGLRLGFAGEVENGFARVTSDSGSGWVSAQYIGSSAPSGVAGTRYTVDTVHLRTGPSTRNGSITVMPIGVKLELTGAGENGFARVSTQYGTGWVSTQYIGSSAPASTETGYTNDAVRLRSGPGTSSGIIRTLPVGTKLALTGERRDGYDRVRSNYGSGWVASAYVSGSAPQSTGGTSYTTDSVNLRRGSSLGSSVIRVIPSRTSLRFTGTVQNGYGKVATSFGDGWVSTDYLTSTRPAPPSGSRVVWPVKGGEWTISQGYNGSSHQNETQYWQYYYSFDLKRSSGATAWQPVYAPVDGRIRWIDEDTGGMSIYMGDGLAFAMFHVLWDDSVDEGDTIRQGQYLGVIAPAGQANNGGSPHLHITGWKTSDEGNWSRRAQPFVGRFSIEGTSFPSTGDRNDYWGYTFRP